MSDFTSAPAPAPVQAPQERRSNGLGLASLIVGIVAIVGSAIPIVNFVSIFLGVIALVLGIIGLVLKGRRRGLAIAGTILGGLALIIGIVTASFYATAADSISKAIESSSPLSSEAAAAPSDEASADASDTTSDDATPRTVRYEVTSDDASLTNVTYLTFNDGASSMQQDNATAAPWSKDIAIKDDGLFQTSMFSLVAQAGANATTITCKITADGKTIQEATSTGPYAVATCSGTAK
ncbi:MmpS family transport accessory protein [Curtobacterium sp. VKM Ac-2922]|uniref:MmpS family transport accessory protein n=1 Tax=Curtobacterium sp. VKM Ac-2922 TaxID=2929475 RepID=UPI001FB2AE07|nr:MmpS family transport accessory protein [Curtobacterium sp. VKM Ac-2922]MCJ1713234.1 MmpS family transport accessory protein [Curtobacterium sp. VKM Ac-2922]